ncbi:MAG: helix-turn-helix domain-containing protein [Bacteroidetes bacterium]|nr:helix-turn-helix domain-containing protein [Bacteroidota bacterium]
MYQINLSEEERLLLASKLKSEKSNKIYRRLQCIHFKQLGLSHQIIASSLSVHVDTVTDWIKLYHSKGLSGLCNLNYDGRRSSKLEDYLSDIRSYIDQNLVSTISQLQDYLLTTHDLYVEQSWLYRYCKKNSIHLIKKHD